MKKKIFTTMALLCCFAICYALVTGPTGKWAGSFRAPDGNDYTISYVFKVDGDKLTGSVITPVSEEEITNGKINGDDFSFLIKMHGEDASNTCKYYSSGDSVSVTLDFNGIKMHSRLTRQTR